MDPFTQNLISRTKQRQEYLKSKLSSQTPTKIRSNAGQAKPSPGKELSFPHCPSNEAPFQGVDEVDSKENGLDSTQEMKKKEQQSTTKLTDGKEPAETFAVKSVMSPASPGDLLSPQKDARRNRLANLAHHINDWEDESFLCSSKSTSSTPVKNKGTPGKYSACRSAGTPTKQDFTHRNSPTPSSKGLSVRESPKTKEKAATPTKAVESQGFTASTSRTRLIYEFEKERKEPVEKDQSPFPRTVQSSPSKVASTPRLQAAAEENAGQPSPYRTRQVSPSKVSASALRSYASPAVSDNGPAVSVLSRAALFDTPRQVPKDPTELPLSERKALFERNGGGGGGQPPTPKMSTHPLANSRTSNSTLHAPSQVESQTRYQLQKQLMTQTLSAHQNASSAKASRMKELDELRNRHNQKKPRFGEAETTPVGNASPRSETPEPPPSQCAVAPPALPPPSAAAAPVAAAPRVVGASPKKELKGGARKSAPLPIPKKIGTAPYPGLDRCRPIRVSPPKAGMLYPCLSDIEMNTDNESESEAEAEAETETETEPEPQVQPESRWATAAVEEGEIEGEHERSTSDRDTSQDMDSSFTADILGRAGLSQFLNTPKRKLDEMQQRAKQSIPEQKEMEDSDEMGDISDLLNEALEGSNECLASTFSKQRKSDLGSSDTAGDGPYPLYHSVSFYRKKKQELTLTPVKQVILRNPEVTALTSPEEAGAGESQPVPIHQQIRHFQEEINAQQIVMSQASQALNLCRATAEFSGSTEQVEGERLLLVASQKRLAAMNEIQRLKTEAALRKVADDVTSSGTLSISNLALPLKKEFLTMLSKGGDDFVHYFVMLVRTRGQVIPTQMVSSVDGVQDGALRFPNLIQLRDLTADFNVAVEVYALQTRKEKLAHEAKYHIRKESSRMRLTPKKLLNKQESRLMSTPTVSGAAGSHAVRSSSFGLVGHASISAATLHRKEWTLEKVPLASPISGSLDMKIASHTDCLVEERGFLTVFEDVGGFGAWHRRWCRLSNDQLLFWKYPDDEKRKDPLGSINLRTCVTEHVDVVSRDICARPNTFLLVTVRQPQSHDKDSLVMTCYPRRTALRHLLSADLKEERHQWCRQINRVLANLRAWDPDAQKPSIEGTTLIRNPGA